MPKIYEIESNYKIHVENSSSFMNDEKTSTLKSGFESAVSELYSNYAAKYSNVTQILETAFTVDDNNLTDYSENLKTNFENYTNFVDTDYYNVLSVNAYNHEIEEAETLVDVTMDAYKSAANSLISVINEYKASDSFPDDYRLELAQDEGSYPFYIVYTSGLDIPSSVTSSYNSLNDTYEYLYDAIQLAKSLEIEVSGNFFSPSTEMKAVAKEKKSIGEKILGGLSAVVATGAVGIECICNSAIGIADSFADGVTWAGSRTASAALVGAEYLSRFGSAVVGLVDADAGQKISAAADDIKSFNDNMVNAADSIIAYDLDEEARDMFYDTGFGKWAENNSVIKNDGLVYGILNEGTQFAAATALTIITGGAYAAAAGALVGAGHTAENLSQNGNSNTAASVFKVGVSALLGGFKWSSYGKLGEKLFTNLTTNVTTGTGKTTDLVTTETTGSEPSGTTDLVTSETTGSSAGGATGSSAGGATGSSTGGATGAGASGGTTISPKSAYRKAVKQVHPDMFGREKVSDSLFKEIKNAWENFEKSSQSLADEQAFFDTLRNLGITFE